MSWHNTLCRDIILLYQGIIMSQHSTLCRDIGLKINPRLVFCHDKLKEHNNSFGL